MAAYHELTSAKNTTREAKQLTGIARCSAERDRRHPSSARPARRVPANALTGAEREQVLRLLHSPQFVDAAPAQIYAALLDQGVYVGSIATMYVVDGENGAESGWPPCGDGRRRRF